MGSRGSAHEGSLAVQRVFARVGLEPEAERRAFLERIREREEARDPRFYEQFAAGLLSKEMLRVHVSLSAELSDGRRIRTAGRDFGLSGPRRGVGAIAHRYHGPPLPDDRDEQLKILERHRVGPPDIEDRVNGMLGRDPAQRRPPRLAWGKLIEALAREGIAANDEMLIEIPLTVELDDELQAELEGL